uniref:Uncharacterized protein n=1 Tax=viral metagenome TaxID=1070528 RepID=A0A6M3L0E5_9ZZZZ
MSERPYQPFYKPYGMSDEEYEYEKRIAAEKLEQWEQEQNESNLLDAQVSLQGAGLKTKYRFIHFVEGLKDEWTVWTNKKDEYLGVITFHKKWKEWEFAPENYTGYTKQCLIDLADFIKQLKAPQSN